MKSKYLYTSFSLLLILFLAFTAATTNNSEGTESNNKNIIKFSHQFHIELETECADCHSGAAESTSLSDRLLPEKDDCAACHDVEDEEECSTCHYEDVYEPLVPSTSDLTFDHAYHVTDKGVQCVDCHQGLEDVTYSFESAEYKPNRADCIACHNESFAVNGKPGSHSSPMFMKEHKFVAKTNGQTCASCHESSFCEDCHVSTTSLSVGNTADDFYTPYSPHNYTKGVKQQQITRVHDLNYRFTHGIDARSKSFQCQTCHDTQLFCNDCHNSEGGDFAQGGFLPVSHTVANFKTIGVGTGGGEHAVLARRDIESCASCHDVQGGDPSCILCHTDNDGIKGTNAKTHKLDFLNSRNGDWHSDMGSICYNCHTDANARPNGIAGIGFCGYCHGTK